MGACDGLRMVKMRMRKSPRRRNPWRHVMGRRIRVMKKMGGSRVRRIIRERGRASAQIAQAIKISTVWVKKLWARYRDAGPTAYRILPGS